MAAGPRIVPVEDDAFQRQIVTDDLAQPGLLPHPLGPGGE